MIHSQLRGLSSALSSPVFCDSVVETLWLTHPHDDLETCSLRMPSTWTRSFTWRHCAWTPFYFFRGLYLCRDPSTHVQITPNGPSPSLDARSILAGQSFCTSPAMGLHNNSWDARSPWLRSWSLSSSFAPNVWCPVARSPFYEPSLCSQLRQPPQSRTTTFAADARLSHRP